MLFWNCLWHNLQLSSNIIKSLAIKMIDWDKPLFKDNARSTSDSAGRCAPYYNSLSFSAVIQMACLWLGTHFFRLLAYSLVQLAYIPFYTRIMLLITVSKDFCSTSQKAQRSHQLITIQLQRGRQSCWDGLEVQNKVTSSEISCKNSRSVTTSEKS